MPQCQHSMCVHNAVHALQDATLAVYCARAWLWVHEAWDGVIKPRLPKAYVHVWDRVLVLQVGGWGGCLGGPVVVREAPWASFRVLGWMGACSWI